ncbi:unnamed protein product, partial [Meganyctiphanes norvegica]
MRLLQMVFEATGPGPITDRGDIELHYICKIIRSSSLESHIFKNFTVFIEDLIEVKILKKMKHPNIIGYKNSFLTSVRQLNIVQDYCDGGDLNAYIKACVVEMPELRILKWSIQLSAGLDYIHKMNLIHRDIKPHNVFLSANKEQLRIGDFGESKILDYTGQKGSYTKGTSLYRAPELLEPIPDYDNKVDVWAAGCTIHQMATLKATFYVDKDETQKYESDSILGRGLSFLSNMLPKDTVNKKIQRGSYQDIPSQYSNELRKIISTMLQVNPESRPSMSQIRKENKDRAKKQSCKDMLDKYDYRMKLRIKTKIAAHVRHGGNVNEKNTYCRGILWGYWIWH